MGNIAICWGMEGDYDCIQWFQSIPLYLMLQFQWSEL